MATDNGPDTRDGYFSYARARSEHVSSFSAATVLTEGLRTVAFYLPQFHPFEENDRWWGKGFTEWSNVAKAVPQFAGHYQPHLPGELGFYDLRTPGVQERQAELAKAAGIAAFCFYFYWFNGKRLMELPIRQFAENSRIDLQFCLCWANENWTRAWDGRDDDVLIAQNYSESDDLKFIAHLSGYINNYKYLRVDDKPLIVLYRPKMLPDARATVRRWRNWCRDHGHGEIFVAYAQTFEKTDPAVYGMDAAIQFPPNDSRWTPEGIARTTDSPQLFNKDYAGELYDYRDIVRRAREYVAPAFTAFRGVCPSWDNEARRPGKGKTLVNSSPSSYLEFLESAASETIDREPDQSRRLVFINAWNEWAEGAHLEPDQRYGYAFLEATRMAMLRSSLRARAPRRFRRLAICIHAYYPEVLEGLLARLRVEVDCDFYISTVPEKREQVAQIAEAYQIAASVVAFDNRGRDILPFLSQLGRLDPEIYSHILKLHTKRSPQRSDGGAWRAELYHALANPDHLRSLISFLEERTDVGLVGPTGHLLAMQPFLNINHQSVADLARRMGIRMLSSDDVFVAGSMFLARIEALLPLNALGLMPDDFEPEDGQTNGTLAHAIERAFFYSAKAASLRTGSFSFTPDGVSFGSEGATEYPYAEASPPEYLTPDP